MTGSLSTSRIHPLLTIILVLATLLPTARAQGEEKPTHNRFNVLFIAIDDLRPELGCYGERHAHSPHLDALARQSVLFTRHYVQVPTCGASRYALLTGRSPAHSGVTSNNAALYSGRSALRAQELPGAQSLPELFRRSGYHTVCIGKISHTPDGRVFAYNGKGDGHPELPGAWDELPTPFGPWKRGWGTFFAYRGGLHREDGQGHSDLMEFTAEKDEELPDGLMAATGIEKLREMKKTGLPFFLGLGFFKPHLPFVATKQDWEALRDTDVSLPPQGKIASPYWHGSGEFFRYKAPFAKKQPLELEAQRRARRAYLACVRYVDRQVGKVLQALDDLGMADNTLVVVWGDHGWHLGEQQIWGKHSPFERAVRSVLMVRAPGVSKPGLKTDALVETVDLYPTLVDLCSPRFSRTEHPLDGKSLRPILTGEQKLLRSAALSYWKDAVSVRTSTHRLVTRVKKGAPPHLELYDLSSNPDSIENLATKDPGLVSKLQGYLPPPR